MAPYHFVTPEFGISETGIHLLRGGYNHTTIDFQDITSIEIKRGKEFKNWGILLVFSIVLIGFGLVYASGLFQAIFIEVAREIYVEELVVPVMSILLGGYCLYLSLRNGTTLNILNANGKTNKFTLRDLEKANQLSSLKTFLGTQLGAKFQG